jgi:hypothetical protein
VGLPYLAVTRGWHDRPVRRHPVVLAVSLLLLVGCGGENGSDVVKVATFPWPKGPGPVIAAQQPVPGIYVPLDRIRDAIPKALPKNATQGCRFGAIVEVTLRNGRILRYGPCDRPASIERLRLTLIRAARHEHRVGISARPVTPGEWKSVIRDWYDGRFDHRHRCSAVREAIRHLPFDPPVGSTIVADFAALERSVCSRRLQGRRLHLSVRRRARTGLGIIGFATAAPGNTLLEFGPAGTTAVPANGVVDGLYLVAAPCATFAAVSVEGTTVDGTTVSDELRADAGDISC